MQPPMNGQHGPSPPQQASSGAPPPPQQHQAPQPPYYQQHAPPPPPQYYQQGPPPPMWGHQPHYAPPPQQYAPPPHQYGLPPPQQYAPPLQQYAPPPQQYAPPPQHYAPPPQQYGTAPGSNEVKSLWIGDLLPWMDENYLYSAFESVVQQIASIKIIRNKQSQQSEGYGFIEFHSRAAAEHTLMNFNGRMMPNIKQAYKLNWASSSAGEKRGNDGPDHTIFVGDLAADVTDYMLEEAFKASYPSVGGAKVVTDRVTGNSKGYGFVHFRDITEQTRAMTEMNGMMLSTRQMRIGPAANKKDMGAQQTYATNGTYQGSQGSYSEDDPNNTTVFVGGLDSNVNEEYLRQVFTPYGEIGYVKIPVGKRCGFVQFTSRSSAEEAIRMLNGTQIGGQSVFHGAVVPRTNRPHSKMSATSLMATTMDTNRVMKVMAMVHPMHKIQAWKATMDTLVMATMISSSSSHHSNNSCQRTMSSSSSHHPRRSSSSNPHSSHRSSDNCQDKWLLLHARGTIRLEGT